MTFTEFGGRGMAEAASGLPINTRRVQCPYALGSGASSNLDWIASDFYEEHCVGCEHRHPTGELPTLASIIEERKAEAATVADAERRVTEQRRAEWQERVEQLRGLTATADPAMAQTLDDIGVLDAEPEIDVDEDARGAALRRLSALAERAPGAFTQPVIDLALQLVNDIGIVALLGPLRHLARDRDALAPTVVGAAIAALRCSPDPEAGRCVTELQEHVDAEAAFDAAVVRSLVYLAGAPTADFLDRRRRSRGSDPSPLRVAAGLGADMVVAVLKGMLPSPPSRSRLVLPPGERTPKENGSTSEYKRASAAGAVLALATTHPDLAGRVADALVLNLGVDGDDRYDNLPIGSVKRALATMFLLGIGDISARLEVAGATAGEELRERHFEVYELTAHLLDPHHRWREPGDPEPTEERRRTLLDQLVGICLRRTGGDWGHNIAFSAANLVEYLAELEVTWAVEYLNAFLGVFLRTVSEIDNRPQSRLSVVDESTPTMTALEELGRCQSFTAASNRLLNAVEHAAGADAVAVCTAIADLIENERGSDRGVDVVWRLLPLLGKIGRRHGDQSGVLRLILPSLYTYLVDSEVSLRSAALDAWVEIASTHPVPSSVSDLLPALLVDPYFMVIRSLLRAAARLDWNDEDHIRLLHHALYYCAIIDSETQRDTLKAAMSAVSTLTHDSEALRSHGEALLLRRAADLDGYDLRDTLRRNWLPHIAHSEDMATLRLAQARDPRINARFNARDDEELWRY